MRTILSVIVLGLVASCATVETNSIPKLVDDPVAAIKATLPEGWVIQEVCENTYPPYRPEGKGRAVFLGVPRKQGADEKPPYEAVVYFMPKDYGDGGEDPTHGQAQTWPARLIATTDSTKIYLWDFDQGRGNLKNDILKTIVQR